jgi:hypothetical protein
MPRLWIAGYNAAGYLPVMEPAEFDNFGEAAAFIIEELQLDAERMADEGRDSAAEQCEELWKELQDSAPHNRDWSGTARGFEYWIKESAQ